VSSDAEGRTTITAVQRATAVLQLFIDSGRGRLGVTEIAGTLGLSKAVVHRILASMREAGFIDVHPESRQYALGPAALALGLAYLGHLDVRALARPALEELSRATQETATLSIRHGATRVYVDQVPPDREVKMTVPLGRPFPLHAGSSSKAFLAFLSDAEQEDYLRTHPLAPLATATITDPGQLRRDLATIRKRGYAWSREERQPGAASVAAPVFDHEGAPVAVVSVCGPAERFRAQADRHARLLLEQVRGLSRRMGFR
jgi:IclR family transcriptional regulator, acetate operon repressor